MRMSGTRIGRKILHREGHYRVPTRGHPRGLGRASLRLGAAVLATLAAFAPGLAAAFPGTAPHDAAVHLTGNWFVLMGVIVSTGLALMSGMYKFHRDRKVDAELAREAAERTSHEIQQGISHMGSKLADRIVVVETKTADFLPRSEIERQIGVERQRSRDEESELARRIEIQERAMLGVQTNIARLDQHQVDLNSGMRRIEADLKALAQTMDTRLARILDVLLTQAK